MEGIIKYLLIFTILFSPNLSAKKKYRNVAFIGYYKNLFGHIHKNPSRYSQSLSTIGCNHPIKVLGKKGNPTMKSGFYHVNVGPYKGYLKKGDISKKRNKCYQNKYPRFFDYVNPSLTEMYYWGKLYDLYNQGKSKIK